MSLKATFLLLMMALLGCTSRKDDVLLGKLAFSSDRSGQDAIYLLDVGGHETPRLVESACSEMTGRFIWTLAGKHIVYACKEQVTVIYVVSDIYMFNLESNYHTLLRECREAFCAGRGMSDFRWTHNGECLAWLTKDSISYFGVEISLSKEKNSPCANQESVDLAEPYGVPPNYNRVSCSLDGRYCLQGYWKSDSDQGTWLTSGISVSLGTDIFSGAAWSPDSQRVAFTVFDYNESKRDLYVMDVVNSRPAQIATELDINEGKLSWSPDSSWIAFSATQQGDDNLDIYAFNVETNEMRRITDDPADDFAPAWQPMQH